jgi:cobalamin biosynthesis protein CbiG
MALGIGLSSQATADDVAETIGAVLAEAGWRWEDVDVVATRGRLARDQLLVALDKPVAGFDDTRLSSVPVPTSGTPALERLAAPPVAEAAALLAAGTGSRLVVPKRTGRHVTMAAAASPPT